MNSFSRAVILALLVLASCQSHDGSPVGQRPSEGWEVGSGGDPIALEFVTRGKFVLSVLSQEHKFQGLLTSSEKE